MRDSTRSMLRTYGALGAALVVFSTFVAWYSFRVAFDVPAAEFVVPESLWSLYPLAAAFLVAGSIVALVCAYVPALASRRAAGVVIAALGIAVIVYSAVRIFDYPPRSLFDTARPAQYGALEQVTDLDGGPFLCLVGGGLLILGSLPVLVPPSRESASLAGRRPAMGGPSV
jgi:tryptophan-associated transmembrane protein